jgi:hypothetical protein
MKGHSTSTTDSSALEALSQISDMLNADKSINEISNIIAAAHLLPKDTVYK